MWNISVLKEKTATFQGQYEDFHDAIREAQGIANAYNSAVSVHRKDGHYKIVQPERKEIKCTMS